MKHIKYLIPCMLITASLIGIYVLTVFASPYKFYKMTCFDGSINPNAGIEYMNKNFAESYQTLEKAYEISPNESVLHSLTVMSCPVFANFESKQTIPDNFFEKCEKYNREALKYMDEKGVWNLFKGDYIETNLDYGYDESWEYRNRFSVRCNLAYALFMQGRTEEAKQEAEEYIKEYSEMLKDCNSLMYAFVGEQTSEQFFGDTYALSDDEGYKAWVVLKEQEITSMLNASLRANPELLKNSEAREYKDNDFINRSYDELVELYK